MPHFVRAAPLLHSWKRLPGPMGYSARDSLKHEYALFVEREIEEYKDRVPRAAILKIADEAVQHLHSQEQVTLNELVLWRRGRPHHQRAPATPRVQTWVRRRRKELESLRRPERWGLTANAPIVRNVPTSGQAHVLVAQPSHERAALFLAANGCTVTAVEPHADIVERVLKEANESGLSARVEMVNSGLNAFAPTGPLAAVVYTPAAFAGLSASRKGTRAARPSIGDEGRWGAPGRDNRRWLRPARPRRVASVVRRLGRVDRRGRWPARAHVRRTQVLAYPNDTHTCVVWRRPARSSRLFLFRKSLRHSRYVAQPRWHPSCYE